MTDATSTPFDDLDEFLALPRVSGLAVSPDGSRVVTSVAEAQRKAHRVRQRDMGSRSGRPAPARRLTRGAKGESSPVFTADGDLLFVAARPTEEDDKPPAALWRLPAAGGEAVEALALPGGVEGVRTARAAAATVVAAKLLRSARASTTTSGCGPCARTTRSRRFCTAAIRCGTGTTTSGPTTRICSIDLTATSRRDLTPRPGQALREADFDVSPDGSFVVTSWQRPAPGASHPRHSSASTWRPASAPHRRRSRRRPGTPAISPDGSAVAFTRETHSTPDKAPRITLCHMRFGENRVELAADWDRWPTSVTWSPDGSALIVTADEDGRGPVFRSTVERRGRAAHRRRLRLHRRARRARRRIYALRSSYAAPPHPVRIDPDGAVTALPCVDAARPARHADRGRRDRRRRHPRAVMAGAARRRRSRRRCCCGSTAARWPAGTPGTGGGTRGCWPRAGYAVLLPDPALSTGYGQDFIQRGWGAGAARRTPT